MKRFVISAAVVLVGLAISFGFGTVYRVPLDPGLAVVALGFAISHALGVGGPTVATSSASEVAPQERRCAA